MPKTAVLALGLGAMLMGDPTPTCAADRTLDEVRAMMKDAEAHGLVRRAKRSKPVDVRPARPGEVIVTVLAGEEETRSRPAKEGDRVVRSRCEAKGNEEYLVAPDKFAERYESTGKPAGPDGWQEHRPLGKVMRFFVLKPEDGEFAFTAPWGERMIAKPGDAIVQDPADEKDTYRVAAAAFACTYEVLD